jgi:hypothetical protein
LPLIFTENWNYGFRRNMLGLRSWGTALAAITTALGPGRNGDSTRGHGHIPAEPAVGDPDHLGRRNHLMQGDLALLGQASRALLR